MILSTHPTNLLHPARRIMVAFMATLAMACVTAAAETVAEDLASPSLAQADDLGFADLSLEDLMMVEVTSSARQALPLNQSSVPVSVITAKDIHYGGRTNVAEMLQFTPGVDVLFADQNRPMVGVRGLHDQFSERTLLLIDSRTAEDPAFGGPEFHRLPLITEDIERIEVVRGPGGAAWGANAFNGVINVITKAPEDTQGLVISTQVTEFGSSYNQLRYGDTTDSGWAWRVSTGYEDLVGSDDATYQDNFVSDDFRRQMFLGTKATRDLNPDTRITLDAALSVHENGQREQLFFDPAKDSTGTLLRVGGKLEHDFSSDTNGYVQWSGIYDDVIHPALASVTSYSNDIETQFNFHPAEHHQTSVGGNVRWVHIEPNNQNNGVTLGDGTYDESFAGLFAIDRWDITNRFTFETQVRMDYYSPLDNPLDWSTRLTGLYALDPAKHHVVRLSGARAFRSPFGRTRESTFRRIPLPTPPFPPNSFGASLNPNPNLLNEHLTSFEAGYTGQLNTQWSVQLNGYLQQYDDLIAFASQPSLPGTQTIRARNSASAVASGIEAETSWQNERTKISVYYGYSHFDLDSPDDGVRAFLPAQHKAGVNARFHLTDSVTFNTHYRYTSTTPNSQTITTTRSSASSFNLVDLSLSFPVTRDNTQLTLGVQDLLDETDFTALSISDSSAFSPNHPTAGRTLFARLRIAF
ncbi:MAG: TonB-dependent receptor [Algisphaera sp.]